MPEWYLVALHILAFLGICWTVGFVAFTAMQKRSHPPIRDEQEETELAETRIYWPPEYHFQKEDYSSYTVNTK